MISAEEILAQASQPHADKLFNEAEGLIKVGTAESFRNSIAKYRQAADLWRSENNPREAEALTRIALSYYNLDEYIDARDYYTKALAVCGRIDDRSCQAQSLNGIGRAYWGTGDAEHALDFYTQALDLRRKTNNRIGEAYTLGNIGIIYLAIGEGLKALEHYDRALSIMKEINSNEGQAFILYNIGLAYATRSENAKALENYISALRLQRLMKDSRSEASTLNNIGLVYAALGEDEKALDYLDLALALRRKRGHRPDIAVTLRNLGDAYARRGERDKALASYDEAIPLAEQVGDRRMKAYALDSVGVIHWTAAEYEKSLAYFNQALRLFREVTHKDGEATALANIGRAYERVSQYDQARASYNSALSKFRQVADRPGEIRTLYNIANLERNHNNLSDAYRAIQSALRVVEDVRSNISVQDLRASYFATIHDYYALEIDILMRLHKQAPGKQFDALALQANEQALARGLLEVLAESHIDIREGADVELLQKQDLLKQALEEKKSYRTRLLSDKGTAQQVATVERDLDAMNLQYEEMRSALRKSSPKYSALTQPRPLDLAEIQQHVLDANTLLLEYALGPDRSFLFAITSSSLSTFELPSRSQVENLATELHDSLRARNHRPAGESLEQRAKRLMDADAKYKKSANLLSQIILAPALRQLPKKRLLIVAPGALQYVPFAALPVPSGVDHEFTNAGETGRPLIVDHEIISLPSASTLAVLRREAQARTRAPKSLLIFADPVFAKSDSRIKPSILKKKTGNVIQSSSADDTLPRLIFSRAEAQNVSALVPANGRREALNFDANRSLALTNAADYRIVHFATHTKIDSLKPERSEIVLSRFTESGDSLNGSLSLADIYNLRLSAELVVLSGCETALGKDVRGEGIIGLTRGVMYAGAPRVVSTLWRIDDRVTAEFMKLFYEGMFKRNLSPSAALRAAQIEIWRRRNWQHPYYWAAFTIQGEPNKMG